MKKGKGIALLPIGVFLVLYLGLDVYKRQLLYSYQIPDKWKPLLKINNNSKT